MGEFLVGLYSGKHLADVLQSEGLLPEDWQCRKFELVAAPGELIVLRYEVQMSLDVAQRLARAFEKLAATGEAIQ